MASVKLNRVGRKKPQSDLYTMTFKRPTVKSTVKKEVSKIMNKKVEKKYFDVNNAGSLTNVTAINKLSGVPQGQNDSQRIGDKLSLRNLQYKMELAGADAYNRIRVTIIRWNRDDNNHVVTSGGVYQALGLSLHSPFNFDALRKGDFTILYDKVHNLVLNQSNTIKNINKTIKIKSGINFNAAGTTGEGHIYSLLTSDSGGVAHPSINEYSRITYTDM